MFNFKCLFLKKKLNEQINVVDDEELNLQKFKEEIAEELGANIKDEKEEN